RPLLPRRAARDGADPAHPRGAAREPRFARRGPPSLPRRAHPLLLLPLAGARVTDLVDSVLAACDRWPSEPALTRSSSRPRNGRVPRWSSSRRRARVETLTYADLGARIRATAAGLRDLRMQPG